MQERFLSRWRR